MMHKSVAFAQYPWMQAESQRRTVQDIPISASDAAAPDATFGTRFPDAPQRGHMHVHTGTLPSKLYKFNGQNWIEVDKAISDSYTSNEAYIKYLIDKINKKEISIEDLSIAEQNLVTPYIKT
jgi:hypothetical protein